MTITTRDLTHGWDIDAPEPVTRTLCLDPHWIDDDPMPARCVLRDGHEGEHRASASGGSVGSVRGPRITWAASDPRQTHEVAPEGDGRVKVAPDYSDVIQGRQIEREGAA